MRVADNKSRKDEVLNNVASVDEPLNMAQKNLDGWSVVSGQYGKERVRILRVFRDRRNEVFEMSCSVRLSGQKINCSWTNAENSVILPTDTIKNTLYVLSNELHYSSIEEFGAQAALVFMKRVPLCDKVEIEVEQHGWSRIRSDNGSEEHDHGFVLGNEPRHMVVVVGERSDEYATSSSVLNDLSWVYEPIVLGGEGGYEHFSLTLKTKLLGLELLKVTKSGFENFIVDEYTTLQPAKDRCMATRCNIEFSLDPAIFSLRAPPPFNEFIRKCVLSAIRSFAGPCDKGVYSVSVQDTEYKMAMEIIGEIPMVKRIKLEMPNLHYTLAPSVVKGNDDRVYVPSDSPAGIITLELAKDGKV